MNDILENYAALFSISRFEKQMKSNNLPGSKRTVSNYFQYLTVRNEKREITGLVEARAFLGLTSGTILT